MVSYGMVNSLYRHRSLSLPLSVAPSLALPQSISPSLAFSLWLRFRWRLVVRGVASVIVIAIRDHYRECDWGCDIYYDCDGGTAINPAIVTVRDCDYDCLCCVQPVNCHYYVVGGVNRLSITHYIDKTLVFENTTPARKCASRVQGQKTPQIAAIHS